MGRLPRIIAVAAVSVLSACVTVSTRSTGAETVADLQAEDRYKAVYAEQMSKVRDAHLLLAPSETNPGVCNAGGDKQACIEADAKVIAAMEEMAQALEPLDVPPRFEAADELLREAIEMDIEALELRTQALIESDDDKFQEHKDLLSEAIPLFQQAYEAFPEDNRPQPPP